MTSWQRSILGMMTTFHPRTGPRVVRWGLRCKVSTLLFFCFFHVFEELASLLQANGVDVSQESMYWSGMWHRIHSLAFCEHFAAMVCLDVDRTKWAACLVAWTMKVMASMMWS